MADIFLSYARADRSQVERLAQALEDAGYSVWWDRHLTGGHDFSDDIEAQLNAARACIVAWSSEGVKSHWVRDEASEAREVGKLVPVRFDDTQPPMGFRQLHTIDLSGWPKEESGFHDLLAAIVQKVGVEAAPVTAAPAAKRTMPAILAAVAALALLGVGAWFLSRGDDDIQMQATEGSEDNQQAASLAVMPFRDLSPERDQGWFSDGLAEEITTALARVPDFYVAASGDAFALRNENLTTAQISERLRVDHVLGGSVRRGGDQMRITVELVRASDGQRVWSQSYSRSTEDAIAVQQDIAREVATVLNTALDPEELAQMTEAGTKSIEAYEAAKRLTAESGGFSLEDSNRMFAELDRIQELDPAWTGAFLNEALARYYRMSATTYGFIDMETALADAPLFEASIARVIELTENTDDPIKLVDREQALAMRDAYYLRFDQALERYKKLAKQFPNDTSHWRELSRYAVAMGDWDTVRQAIRKQYELQGPTGYLIAFYERLGDYKGGAKIAREAIDSDTDTHAVIRAGVLLALAGDEDYAMKAYRMLDGRKDLPMTREWIPLYLACRQGDLETVRKTGEADPDVAGRATFLLTGKRSDFKDERYMDRSSPPFLRAGWGYTATWDLTGYPKTRAALDRAGIPHDLEPFDRLRCPGGYQGD